MSLGQVAYEAYRGATNGVSVATGEELPDWYALPIPTRAAWHAAAEAVRYQVDG